MINRRHFLVAASALSVFASVDRARADNRADEPVRIATLASGTVAWEIDTIIQNGFDKKHGIHLSMVPVAGKQGADVLLAGGAADVIVTDWIWVSRQRNAGADYTFLPYSRQVGSILVKATSPINKLSDLKNRKIGIAGGPTDKSWILLRAWALKQHSLDLAKEAEPVFAAPPLLNELFETGGVDALVTYWHFAALLKASGAREIATISDAAHALGLDPETPLLGYVFSEKWSRTHDNAAAKLAAASRDAKAFLLENEAEWQRLRPLMKVKNDAEFDALKSGFRAGIPTLNTLDHAAAAQLFEVLAHYGGQDLIGDSATLASGTFAPNDGLF
jgi:NitT/TauT family transport system substrate-binding protein